MSFFPEPTVAVRGETPACFEVSFRLQLYLTRSTSLDKREKVTVPFSRALDSKKPDFPGENQLECVPARCRPASPKLTVPDQAMMSCTTFPETSVRRKSRLLWRKVSCS